MRRTGWWRVAVRGTTVAVVALGLSGVSAGVDAPATSTSTPTTTPTTTPATTATTPSVVAADPASAAAIACDGPHPQGLLPAQVGDRYDLTPVWNAGYRGQGVRVALIEIGTAVDADVLTRYEECIGIRRVPFFAHRVPPGPDPPPPPDGESMSDADMIVGLAPNIDRLDEFYTQNGGVDLATLLPAVLDPANTGGQRVDIISISFNTCETAYETAFGSTDATEALLAQAANEGVWVFKGAGDSGSSACAQKGVCGGPHEELAVDYPASSPSVIATGGIEVNDALHDPPVAVGKLGTTWGDFGNCSGTGGGVSKLFPPPSFQAHVPNGLSEPKRMVPDIASLAGTPGYELLKPVENSSPIAWEWAPTTGDSMTGPFHAAAFAAVLSALRAQHIAPPALLDDALYRIANDPALYPVVFRDVKVGSNDVHARGCCDAAVGYDLNTGLGQLDFTQLALALGFDLAPLVAPTFTG